MTEGLKRALAVGKVSGAIPEQGGEGQKRHYGRRGNSSQVSFHKVIKRVVAYF